MYLTKKNDKPMAKQKHDLHSSMKTPPNIDYQNHINTSHKRTKTTANYLQGTTKETQTIKIKAVLSSGRIRVTSEMTVALRTTNLSFEYNVHFQDILVNILYQYHFVLYSYHIQSCEILFLMCRNFRVIFILVL